MKYSALMVSGSVIWSCVGLFYCIGIFLARREPAIAPRNPWVLLLWASGNILTTNIFWINMFVQQPCHLIRFFAYGILSLIVYPLIFRGLQYVVLTVESYRNSLKFFKSNYCCFICSILFMLFNFGCYEIFYWNMETYKSACRSSWDAIYAGMLYVFALAAAVVLSFKIPWHFDSFRIGLEIKLNFVTWALLGLPAIFIEVSFNFRQDFNWRIPSILMIIMNICSFIISTILPLHMNKAVLLSRYPPRIGPSILKAYGSPSCFPDLGSENKIYPQEMLGAPHENEPGPPSFCGYYRFEDIFSDAQATRRVHDFAKRHFILEVTLFAQAVCSYRTNTSNEIEERYKEYVAIASKFVDSNSAYEINISAKNRRPLLQYLSNPESFLELSCNQQFAVFDDSYKELSKAFWDNFIMNYNDESKIFNNSRGE